MEIKQISLTSASGVKVSTSRKFAGNFSRVFSFVREIFVRLTGFFGMAAKKIYFLIRRVFKKTVFGLVRKTSAFSKRNVRSESDAQPIRTRKRRFKNIILRLFILVFAAGFLLVSVNVLRNYFVGSREESGEEVKGAKETKDLNHEFSFPLRAGDGEEVGEIKYAIETAELRDEIVIKGQKAQAVAGRVFVILNLKITNSHNQGIEINTRDYVRLSVGDNRDEWLAPSMHNDPVEVQAISTKYTRLGFAINDDDEDILLAVGEIDGDKEELELNF